MSNKEIPNFNPGGIPDRVDPRDYTYEEVGFGTPYFDWSEGFDIEHKIGLKLPVKDQNGSGSCGGQAWATLASVLEAVATGTHEERSAKYIYAQTYQGSGGSTGRDNAEIYRKQGVAREAVLTSYDNGKPPTEAFMQRGGDITQEARNDARLDVSRSYATLTCTMDEVARALRDNDGVILLVDGQNNGTWYSSFPMTPKRVEWRHWIYVGRARLINGRKYVGFINSWGTSVGDRGWQWLGEEWFNTGHILQGWTHVIAPPAPPPSFKHEFMVNLAFGQTSGDIKNLQKALKIDGVFPVTVPETGYYGTITARAVLAFRLKYGVSSVSDPQGHHAGPLTRAQLNKVFN